MMIVILLISLSYLFSFYWELKNNIQCKPRPKEFIIQLQNKLEIDLLSILSVLLERAVFVGLRSHKLKTPDDFHD